MQCRPVLLLSASVPIDGNGDPFDAQAILEAVTAIATEALQSAWLVVGGHPSIMGALHAAVAACGPHSQGKLLVYQSEWFGPASPEMQALTAHDVALRRMVQGGADLSSSLRAMRKHMLTEQPLTRAVFVGGMDGIRVEAEEFRRLYPHATRFFVVAPGGVASQLAYTCRGDCDVVLEGVDYSDIAAWCVQT